MNLRRFLILGIVAAMACRPAFNAGAFGGPEELFQAAM